MSPAPARTSQDAIVAAARRILESDGLPAVTMRAVAESVGVRGPSLYKRLPDHAALLRAVSEGVAADLTRTLAGIGKTAAKTAGETPGEPVGQTVAETPDPRADLRVVAMAYRTFVHENPNGYRLLFADLPPGASPDPGTLAAMGLPVVQAMIRLVGEADALEAARTVVAWAHGFVSMELAGAFRLGGDLEAAYTYGIEAILAGISERATPASR
jgi:AcrR family transcriptional regulator